MKTTYVARLWRSGRDAKVVYFGPFPRKRLASSWARRAAKYARCAWAVIEVHQVLRTT